MHFMTLLLKTDLLWLEHVIKSCSEKGVSITS